MSNGASQKQRLEHEEHNDTSRPQVLLNSRKRKTLKERLAVIQQRQTAVLQEQVHDVHAAPTARSDNATSFNPGNVESADSGIAMSSPRPKDHGEVKAKRFTYPKRVQGRPFALPTEAPEYYTADRYYSESGFISNVVPSTLLSSFNALTQSLFCASSQDASAASLVGSKQVRHQTLIEAKGAHHLSRVDESSLQYSPTDIRTVYKVFQNLDPETTTYACCPSLTCCTLYEPINTDDKSPPRYPLRCTASKFGTPCDTPLVDTCGTLGGKSFFKPAKPYTYHHFNDHVAAMLSRPGFEDAIESYATSGTLGDELSDIVSSKAIHDFRDASGQPFLRKDGTELRLVWALGADWFNPHSNKAAGKSVSTGVLAMICLSLPPQLRYLEENIYLCGVIPGAHEPALDAINPFLIPLVNDLNAAYDPGIYFSRTHNYAAGRNCRSAILPLIADTLASKKLTGHLGHASKYFCSRCRLPQNRIDDLNHKCWPGGLTRSEHDTFAEAWRNAPSRREQEKFAKKHGIRWSALLLLPYWQPSEWSIQEGFHVLLLGVVPRHCRDLLGLNFKDLPREDDVDDNENSTPSPAVMEHARCALAQGSPTKLCKLTIEALKALCREQGLSAPSPHKRGRRRKREFVDVLLGCSSSQPFVEGNLDLPSLFDGVATVQVQIRPSPHNDVVVSPSNPIVITQKTLGTICEHIQATLRPSWQAHLPDKFGSPEHGKLKADQWRTVLEFDLPVSLIQILAEYKSSGQIHDDAYFRRVVENTLDLSMALAWGLSRRTSKSHAEKYSFYMHRYLTGVQDLYPDYKLKPVHHYALHIKEILLLFGPLHGTWAFSLERLIKLLQGEMEGTVMSMFCRRANLIRWANSDDFPITLKAAWEEFCTHRDLPDLGSRLPRSRGPFVEGICSDRSASQTLDLDVRDAFLAAFQPREGYDNNVHFRYESATLFHQYEREGVKYSDFKRSAKQSLVYLHPDQAFKESWPAQIRTIFRHHHIDGSKLITEIFVAVHQYLPATSVGNYFTSFPDFRAGLFCLEPASKVKVVKASQIHCHANQRPWDAETVVMRAIDREY